MLKQEIQSYNNSQPTEYIGICELLAKEICENLPEAEYKIWHRHPVWFLDDNPITGYSIQKPGVRLMFWSGADFDEEGLTVRGKKFKDASVFFNDASDVKIDDLKRWLQKSRELQWDYKNIIKRKGQLERLIQHYS
jgi:uncharacterized protein YdhG (YjbR/CyaY superfamily)